MGCGASQEGYDPRSDEQIRGVGPRAQAAPPPRAQAAPTQAAPIEARPTETTPTDEDFGAFCFGDNTDANAIGENDADTVTPAERTRAKSLTKNARREGVSADPILPDAAEHFEPRVVPKSKEIFDQLCLVAKANPLFAALDPEDLRVVVSAMDEEHFADGTVILQEGASGTDKFYFIRSGRVDIVRAREGYICSFTDGQTFGEMELMYLSPCAASVVANGAVSAFTIDRDTYRHIVMMVSIRKRKQHIQYLQQVPFLEGMTSYELTNLADALETRYFKPNEVLIHFGSEGEFMFFITTGEVKVIGRDKQTGQKVEVCTFGPGDVIGELEFIHHHKTVADVVAVGEVKACSLHRAHFEGCMGPVKDLLKGNADNNTKFAYYNAIAQDDGTGNKLVSFTFGDQAEQETGFQSGFGGAFGGDEEDNGDTATDEDSGTQAAITRKKRGGVSDDVIEEDKDWQAPVFPKTEDERQMLRDVLLENPLLKSLEAQDFETVISAMEKHKYADGSLILEQGSEGGSHYHIIEDGTVAILRDGKLIVTFSRGQGFGEMELMYIQPCVATVAARGAVTTWAIDRTTYKRLVMQVSIKRRNLYTELLGGVDFLERMSEYEKGTLADALTPVTFLKGESIIRRGERNESMYIIVSGQVEVLGVPEGAPADDMALAATRHICFLERGACVGELEFLNQHLAVANCVAFDEVRACTLHRDHFEMCMGPIMDVLRKTVRQDKYEYYNSQLEDLHQAAQDAHAAGAGGAGGAPVARTQRRQRVAVCADTDADDGEFVPPDIPKAPEQLALVTSTVRRCPLFSGLTEQDRNIVIGALEPISYPLGHVLFQQGEVPEESYWYIIAKGAVEQIRDSAIVVARFEAGQSFGEIELMYTTPAQVTTRVCSPNGIEAFRLDRKTYRKIVMSVAEERRKLYRELLTGVPFAEDMTEQQHVVLADALTPIHFAPGDRMIRIGEQNEWMYVIVDGVVEVHGVDGNKVCDLRRGEMVGELEFLNKHAAVADCTAKTHVQACKLHREHFEMALGPCSDFIKKTLEKPKYSYYNLQRKAAATAKA